MSVSPDRLGTRATLERPQGSVSYYALDRLSVSGQSDIARLPNVVKVLLENVLRNHDGRVVTDEHVEVLARWNPAQKASAEIPFLPARVLLQDFTGVPAVVDFAALRSAVARLGGDPERINPLAPVDLVIDHSVQIDQFGTTDAFRQNVELEYDRNTERYSLLRWAGKAFNNFRVVPPGTGIVHQVNIEYLASVVTTRERDGQVIALPDTLVGTDSHTTMVNGLGVLGWGVGGIEAEACLLGQPLYLLLPEVVGFKFVGRLPEGATATDLVLTVTQILRKHGVVGRFVEYFGSGLSSLGLADRATIANMAPEYGATAGFFPVDQTTLDYLRLSGRDESLIDLVERFTKAQGLFRTDETPDPAFNETLELDLGTVEPSLAGPRRPQDRVPLPRMKDVFGESYGQEIQGRGDVKPIEITVGGETTTIDNGAVAIAAITSCTNTSNPSVLIGAGLLAKNAVEKGLRVKPFVKTSLAPGSQVVTDYLTEANLLPYLEALGFHVVGYGCTTCIGNSGPLPDAVANAVQENDMIVSAVLSGNRNFEGRIHPQVRASYLASPPLVVAFALAGRTDIDLTQEPIGQDPNGGNVFLRDIWPTSAEVNTTMQKAVRSELFRNRYANVFLGDEIWQGLPTPEGALYDWDPNSTYAQEPPYFQDMSTEVPPASDIVDARVLVMLDDSITTDHISPAGSIQVNSPAGKYLIEHGVDRKDFNSYGARRGNHEVMIRGTFANIRLRNRLVEPKSGPITVYLPTGEETSIYDASMRYQAAGIPLIVIAGKEYGSGSSRDWAAKGTQLLGVRAVIVESYERIHRSNLVGMGVLPLQFKPGENKESLGLTGRETYTIRGISGDLQVGQMVTVQVRREDGSELSFEARARIDSPIETEYYRNGGILQYVLRNMLAGTASIAS